MKDEEMSDLYPGISIPTYVINLRERTDRYAHIMQQFEGKTEFDLHIIEACQHTTGAVGLWNSIVKIIGEVNSQEDDVIIICEDDHIFTKAYERDYLIRNIVEASAQGCELLTGGIGGFGNVVPIAPNRYWVDWLWSTQFIVLYRPVFQKILDEPFKKTDVADGVLSRITSQKMVLYPFISVQKDFGYSDVTESNNEKGNIENLFVMTSLRLEKYRNMIERYNLLKPKLC